jgi:hypothetical protein
MAPLPRRPGEGKAFFQKDAPKGTLPDWDRDGPFASTCSTTARRRAGSGGSTRRS